MSDKQVKVAKPAKTKPQPVKPTPISPSPVKPTKAHADGEKAPCIRCGKPNGDMIRAVCSPCDRELQQMHWSIEHTLFNKVFYAPEPNKETPTLEWLKSHGYQVGKPQAPWHRTEPRGKIPTYPQSPKPNEALAL